MKLFTLTAVGVMAFLISGCSWLFAHDQGDRDFSRYAENQILVESAFVFGQLAYDSETPEDVEFVSFEEAVSWAESLTFITEEEKTRFVNGLRTASFPADATFAVGYTAGCHFDDARLVFDGHFIFLDPFHSSGVVAECIRAEPYAAAFVLEDVVIPETLEAQ